MFTVIGGPYENEEDCIGALYDYDEELRNVRGPNGKRTFSDEDIDRIMSDTLYVYTSDT